METGEWGVDHQPRLWAIMSLKIFPETKQAKQILFSIENEWVYKEIRVDTHGYGQWKEIHVRVPLTPHSVC